MARDREMQGALRAYEYALSHPGTVEFDTNWLLTHIAQVMSDHWAELDMGQKTLRALIAGLVAFRGRNGGDNGIELTLATWTRTRLRRWFPRWGRPRQRDKREKGAGEFPGALENFGEEINSWINNHAV